MTTTMGKKIAIGSVVLLALAHYDFWFWDDHTLWFGFLPVGLGYHALISVLASVAWALVVRFAWPQHLEDWASGGDAAGGGS